MIVEIRGIQFINKGAELMLVAVLDRLRDSFDDVTFAASPVPQKRPYEKLAALGIRPKAWLRRYRIQWGYLANMLPFSLTERYGIVTDAQVDVVLDASGFAYGDQWGPGYAIGLARAARHWRSQGTKLILLPQAFGPFTSSRIRSAFKSIVQHADRLYARDPVSLTHITDLVGPAPHIGRCPDFTVSTAGEVPPWFNPTHHDVAIIPNQRMIDKGSQSARQAYLPFLVHCLRHLTLAGCRPFFLIHGGRQDQQLASKALGLFGEDVPTIFHDDPIQIKGILGACKIVVSSRYHGLVNALSQGVPAIATGWSHKYRTLVDYYGCPDLLLSPTDSEARINATLSLAVQQHEQIAASLEVHAKQHAQEVEQMWNDVAEVIGGRER